jgi:predicted permease
MDFFLRDLRFAGRILRRNPGFASLAVLMLALGIGANTLVFSIVDSWLLRPLPFKEPSRLAAVWESEQSNLSIPSIFAPWRHYQAWLAQNTSFESLSGYFWRGYTMNEDGNAESLLGQMVTENYFSTIGVTPVLGRTFEASDANGPPLVVLGYGFWQRHFSASPDVVGMTITLNDRSYSIVGVAPSGVSLPSVAQPDHPEDLWVLLTPDEPNPANKPYRETPDQPIGVLGRLKPGVNVEQARAELTTIKLLVDQMASPLWQNYSPFVSGLQKDATRSIRPTLLLLSGAVLFVLLITCANVAGLMVARMAERRKELVVRAALGAGRRALVQQLLTESLLLSVVGAAIGLLIAIFGLRLFLKLNPFEIPAFNEVAVNSRVLIFTITLSFVTAALFSIIPALQAGRLDINELLKENARGSSHGIRSQRARTFLVGAEIALSLILLTGAGLMARSFARLANEPRGFNPENLVALKVTLPLKAYPERTRQIRFYDRLLERLQSLPSVTAVAETTVIPVYSGGSDELTIEGVSPRPDVTPSTGNVLVSREYFKTVGIPILSGRMFDERDRENTEPVAIVNETLARQFIPDSDALGKRLRIGSDPKKSQWRTIVGVVGDTLVDSYGKLLRHTTAMTFVPYEQVTDDGQLARLGNVVLRVDANHPQLASMIDKEIKALDSGIPFLELLTADEMLSRTIRQPRLQTLVSTSLAAIALLLATIGLYGVISYSVIQRSHEIGIRRALGAQDSDVFKLVISQGVVVAVAGVAVGVIASLLLTRLIKTLLYGVSATDPVIFISISLLLMGISLLACYLPARRAVRVDPMVALRHE